MNWGAGYGGDAWRDLLLSKKEIGTKPTLSRRSPQVFLAAMDLPRFCSGHLIAKNAIKEDGHGIETQ
jgi:hypothetical protein